MGNIMMMLPIFCIFVTAIDSNINIYILYRNYPCAITI
nr:MAG TPA: hypothetical protein [Crassvirales sp.]